MRLTDFWERMGLVFGPAYARSWAQDVVLAPLGCTVLEALDAGTDVTEVWRAVCACADVPDSIA